MKTLKRMIVILQALFLLVAGVAFADNEHGYSRMFVFGASFVDPGNHFAVTGETAHPPFYPITPYSFPPSYGVGGHRFTNGNTWVEVLANDMGLTAWAKPAYRDPAFGNYAFGYGRAAPGEGAGTPGLSDQVQAWIDNGHCTGEPMVGTLFVLDSGYADLLDILFGGDPNVVLPDMVDSIATNIGILYGCGGRNLMVANLFPMGASPGVPEEMKAVATGLSALYNLYVQSVVDAYSGVMNTSIVDFFAFSMAVLATPGDFGFSNVTDSCVTFGVLKDAFCKDRDGYFFWDPLHPSSTAHALLGSFALGQLPAAE